MGILAECPRCHQKQGVLKKKCPCGLDLDKAKGSKRVKYWISYYLPGGKQRREMVGTSIEDAKAAFGKRRGQKKENKIFDMIAESKMTFEELSEWYLGLEIVKDLASYPIIGMKLDAFNREFGQWIIGDIRQADIENYQVKLKKQGLSPATVDQNIRKVKTMVNKAFENDKVSGTTLKAFKRIKPTMKKGSDVRDRILLTAEFEGLMKHATGHTRNIIAMGYYTGMRRGEIVGLTWNKVKLDARVIKLEVSDTKDQEARVVPICKKLYEILVAMPGRLQSSTTDDHVFLYRGKPVYDIREGLKKACKAAGIKYGRFVTGGFVFHDLRHTFNTNMRKAGVSETVIMDITGHSTREMFDRYNTIDDEDRHNAVDQLEVFFKSSDQIVIKPKKKDFRKND